MDHYDGHGGIGHSNLGSAKSKIVRIDLVPADNVRRDHAKSTEPEIQLYEFLDEYETFLRNPEFSDRSGVNCCRAVVPLLKALEAANELVAGMKVSKRPKESWKLSLLRAEVFKCIMNIRALGKRLEQYHSSLGSRGAQPDA